MGDLFGGESEGQETSREFTQEGVAELRRGKAKLEGTGSFKNLLEMIGLQTGDPLTFSPQVVQGMKQQGFDDSSRAFQGALSQIGDRMGALGMFRSGATNQQFQNAAADYGGRVADVSRQIDTQAALQRNQDLAAAVQNAMQVLGLQQRQYENIGNAWIGSATNPVFSQPDSGGIGGLLGTLAGAFIPGI